MRLLPLLLIITTALQAQIANSTEFGGAVIKERQYENISGSPYLNEEFLNGYFESKFGDKYENIPMRYNAYEDLLEIINKDQKFILQEKYVKRFSYVVVNEDGNQDVVHFATGYEVPGEIENHDFVHILYEGEFTVFERISIKMQEDSSPNSYSGASGFSKTFIKSSRSYIERDGKIESFRVNKRGFIREFPEYKNDIKEIVKENSTNFKDDAEVKEFLRDLEDQIS